ncbi:cystathionine gamma-synthase [Xylariales sp. PMI_506]|nr:cystathionine gamma-synthase [Xylariales sp. PMI_506]
MTVTLARPPPLGHALPEKPHAISVQLPKWDDVIDFASGNSRVSKVQQNGYPRSFIHKDIQRVHDLCVQRFGASGDACLLFLGADDAETCRKYISSPPQGELGVDEKLVSIKSLPFRVESESAGTFNVLLHAVFLPNKSISKGMAFWRLTGCGISSRLAEDLLRGMELDTGAKLVPPAQQLWPSKDIKSLAHQSVQQRVAELLERSPIGGPRSPAVTGNDVFLYPTGMSAIFNLTRALRDWPGTKSVVFGFPYELTLKVQQDFAKDCVFYGFGTMEESEMLEDYLHMLAQQDTCIQAVWCECSSNPLLRTADLNRMRRLADRYGFLVIVDDTIGNSANVDVLDVADIVVTSLTKSFSGYANVMGGSVALNPRSRYYERLRDRITSTYVNQLYDADAIKLEANSRDVLPRSAQMNTNAASLVAMLDKFADDPACPLKHVYYPSTCPRSADNFHARMRPATTEFTPGYGGLFTLEFDTVESSARFYNALNVCKGPSIGADFTLALPYVQVVFKHEKDWAAQYGLSETIVRVSVGIEDTESLMAVFLEAISCFR